MERTDRHNKFVDSRKSDSQPKVVVEHAIAPDAAERLRRAYALIIDATSRTGTGDDDSQTSDGPFQSKPKS